MLSRGYLIISLFIGNYFFTRLDKYSMICVDCEETSGPDSIKQLSTTSCDFDWSFPSFGLVFEINLISRANVVISCINSLS